jgi:hypothetical protein
MRKSIIALIGLVLLSGVSYSQDDSLETRIVLIGDAGQLTNGHHPVVNSVRQNITLDKKTTVIFLGDNLYKVGLPDDATPTYNLAKAPLDSQIRIAKGTDAKVIFIPGNHDWNNGSKNGWDAILREQYYIDVLGDNNVSFYPKDGCPGPVEIEISPNVVLVIIDSQWWLHEFEKPGIESDCPYKTKAEVLIRLDDILSKDTKKLVILAFHHTLKSVGIHGGYFKLKQHIFPFTDVIPSLYIPLPIIGSIYPITRGVFGTSEDLRHPLYQSMIHDIEATVKGHKNVIFVAGHEHSLQLIRDSGYNYMVTGSGSKSTRVYNNKRSLFASQKNGYATLEILKDKTVNATYYTVDSNKTKKEYTGKIFDFSKVILPKEDSVIRPAEYVYKDSVSAPASRKYANPTGFKKVVLGNNYRKEWSTPVRMKVFNINKEHGGFTIVSMGGGKETKSLRLRDKDGREYLLRSADKEPEKELPEYLRGSLAQKVAEDLISASHPYAPLIVPTLAKAANVRVATPEIFFVPDDYSFGSYRLPFANSVCLLERRDPSDDTTHTKSTAKTLNKLIQDHDNHVDQEAVLRARLLDILIGDWDRHFDQWRWETKDTGKGKLYSPLPRDRDMALFNSDGLLIKYVSKNELKYLQGFKKNIPDINSFNWQARDFDRIFMNGLSEADWVRIIGDFQKGVTDSTIDVAVKKLPPEIYAIDGKVITEKLKSRRDLLMKEGIKYYKYISRQVTIAGSNDAEYFRLKKAGNGGLEVTVYNKKKNGDTTRVLYHRIFDRHVTKELRLYGLNKDDRFEVDSTAPSGIRVKMIGGKGNDTFDIKGHVRSSLYDYTAEKNAIIHRSRAVDEFSSDYTVNEYKPTGFTSNSTNFPKMNLGYNAEDKLLVGVGFSKKTYDFRKDPYSTYQKLSTLYAFSSHAYQVQYNGIFNQFLFKKDILVNATLESPALRNFYGLGNNTERDANLPSEYYRTRYKYLETDVLLRKRMGTAANLSGGPTYYHYWNRYDDNQGKILSKPSSVGLDSADIYSVKDYLGAKLKFDIYYVNSDFFPSRGIVWNTELASVFGINKQSNNLTKITSDMTVYGSLSEERKVMGVLRIGGGHIFNNNYEYFQALTLGSNNFLRGFRKDRFAGTSTFYSSIEGRVKLVQSKWYILPGDIGVLGFYELGRIWMETEPSNRWHQSYGGGLYYAPFNLVIVSATVGISDEDKLFNFSLGTKFNITF